MLIKANSVPVEGPAFCLVVTFSFIISSVLTIVTCFGRACVQTLTSQ